MTKLLATHRGYEIRKSGKNFVKIYGTGEGNRQMFGRFVSVEAAKAVITANLDNRPMSREEYALVYPNSPFNAAEFRNRVW